MLCASRAGACARVCARGRPDAPCERGERCPRVTGASDRRPFYHPSCGRVNAPAPPFPTFFRNFGTEPPRASKNVGEARAVPKRQAAPRGESHRTRPRCPTFARRAWGAPVAHPARGRAHKPPWGAARESLLLLPRAYQSLGRGKERDYQAEFVFCEKQF